MKAASSNPACPCGSGPKYKRCCRPLHEGSPATSPEQLMRARYSAYALGKVDFIIETTVPLGPQWKPDLQGWRRELEEYCRNVQFLGLRVTGAPLPREDAADQGAVSFSADILGPQGKTTFSETSRFYRVGERWLYHSGKVG